MRRSWQRVSPCWHIPPRTGPRNLCPAGRHCMMVCREKENGRQRSVCGAAIDEIIADRSGREAHWVWRRPGRCPSAGILRRQRRAGRCGALTGSRQVRVCPVLAVGAAFLQRPGRYCASCSRHCPGGTLPPAESLQHTQRIQQNAHDPVSTLRTHRRSLPPKLV